ncbi:hypothetical protein niasHT_031379 [Heterodera trifolii]|uniref:Uncharacterized protein n=1 Tax=Heterodera trifolii TaxID=157864 RepID=A0ABD2J3V9_9BILA
MVVHGGRYGGNSFEQTSIEHADSEQIYNNNETSSEEAVINCSTTSTFGSSSSPAIVRRVDRSADNDDSSEHLRSVNNTTRQTGKETVEDSLENADVPPKERVGRSDANGQAQTAGGKSNLQNDKLESPEQDD